MMNHLFFQVCKVSIFKKKYTVYKRIYSNKFFNRHNLSKIFIINYFITNYFTEPFFYCIQISSLIICKKYIVINFINQILRKKYNNCLYFFSLHALPKLHDQIDLTMLKKNFNDLFIL